MKTMMRSAALSLLMLPCAVFAAKCDVTLGQAQIDFGHFNRGSLRQETVPSSGNIVNVIGRHTTSVTVTCDAPTHPVLYYRAAGTTDGKGFRLGENARIVLIASSAQADNQDVNLSYRNGESGGAAGNARVLRILPDSGLIPATDAPVSRMTFQLDALAVVDNADTRITQQALLASSGAFEVVTHE